MNPNEIRIWAVLLIGMAYFGYLMYQKRKNVNLAKGNALVLIRNKAGRWRFELMPINDDGLIELMPRKGKRAGKTFAIDSESAPDIDYPINKMSFTQTTIPMVVINEENWDPLSNISGRPVLSAGLLDVIRHESWSAHGIRLSHEEDEKVKARKSKSGTPMWVYVAVVAVVGAFLFGWQYLSKSGDLPGIGG